MNAFVAAQASILDFECRLRVATLTANEPFLFCTGTGEENFTGDMTWSLRGFIKALRTIEVRALEFHNRRGDFESWAESSLKDATLKAQLKRIRAAKYKGEELRAKLVNAAQKRFTELSEQVQAATQLF